MPADMACSVCGKPVGDKGGIFCGRRRSDGEVLEAGDSRGAQSLRSREKVAGGRTS